MSGVSTPERIRALEVHVEQMLEDGLRREETQSEILAEVRALKDEIDRYRGFLGGIIWVVSALGLVLYNIAGPLWKWFMALKTGS